ncbi:MAG TPA: SRPBCC domain-containing protein [bacterium]|nr:SRPBCC domain-containing protein [bacterium]
MDTIVQKVKFKASPEKLYGIFLDSKKHSQATGAKAVVSRKVGGKFTAWNGYIRGKNLLLVRGKTIVQSWRSAEFKPGYPDSILVLAFEKAPGGCRLTLTHAGIAARASNYAKGWRAFYWQPIAKYLREK